MCWFRKKKNKQKQVKEEVVIKKPVVEEKEVAKPEVKPEPKVEVKAKEEAVEKTQSSNRYQGKYEVYFEANKYKFRLKASNGEILAVSSGYTTEKGALAGLETFKKNVENGFFEVYTDKSNYSQFLLYTANKARLILVGEFYNTQKQAQSAIESVKKFYQTEKLELIDKIKEDEIREELIDFSPVEENPNGKYELSEEENEFFIRLKANNGQLLFSSQGYASKASAKQGLETIKSAIAEKRFTVGRDKQNRYQFNMFSATNQLILTGETYPQKASCISAINSVLKFGLNAKLVEL